MEDLCGAPIGCTGLQNPPLIALKHERSVAQISPQHHVRAAVGDPGLLPLAANRIEAQDAVADEAIGMKSIEEAVAVRDRLIDNFYRAALLPAVQNVGMWWQLRRRFGWQGRGPGMLSRTELGRMLRASTVPLPLGQAVG